MKFLHQKLSSMIAGDVTVLQTFNFIFKNHIFCILVSKSYKWHELDYSLFRIFLLFGMLMVCIRVQTENYQTRLSIYSKADPSNDKHFLC